MRTLTLGYVVSFGALGLVACEQQTEQPAAPTTPPAATTTTPTPGDTEADMGDGMAGGDAGAADAVKPEVTPAAVCAMLLEAAKAKDDAKFLANSTDVTAQAMTDATTKATIFSMLGGTATCGEATVEGERASASHCRQREARDSVREDRGRVEVRLGRVHEQVSAASAREGQKG